MTSSASPRRALVIRCAAALIAVGMAAAVAGSIAAGCAQQPVTVPTRSLERSGRTSFVCLSEPRFDDPKQIHKALGASRPITDCSVRQVIDITDYNPDADAGTSDEPDGGLPGKFAHLYALVTQTTRGEVAVVDMSATNNSVLDQDPSVPGANFLPIGAQPVDIVSTPGGVASFVGVAEVGREGIFAIPSAKIRPASADPDPAAPEIPAPQISTWPACRLPSAPGSMLLLADPPKDQTSEVRESCDGAYHAPVPADKADLIDLEGLDATGVQKVGRQKLVVAMPDLGGIIVIDAQTLLDRPPGSFDACPVERWLPLDGTVTDLAPPPPYPGNACSNPKIEAPKYDPLYKPRPSDLAFANGRLYASDLSAPLIHVIDLPSPCEPVELDPLRPTSLIEPKRVVTTSRVAVTTALTPDLKRYVYAVDSRDGSAMVFDVSDDQAARTPIVRRHPEWDPLEAPDRIRFAAPIADILTVERDVPAVHPATGVAAHGTRCEPDPSRVGCDPHSQSCDVGTLYRTSSAYDSSGAYPLKLRGEFAFFALSSGKVAVIDIDDYDSRCRQPYVPADLSGCAPASIADKQCTKDDDCPGHVCAEFLCSKACSSSKDCPQGHACTTVKDASGNLVSACELMTSREYSCNVVLPNAPRSSTYEVDGTQTYVRMPGLQVYPLLYDQQGALIQETEVSPPQMVGTLPAAAGPLYFLMSVSNANVPLDLADGKVCCFDQASNSCAVTCDDKKKNVLALNLEDPRAQFLDQNWSVTFEGAIPGFEQQAGKLSFKDATTATFDDADGRFCDAGVLSEKAVLEEGVDAKTAAQLADYLQIFTALPGQQDEYWSNPKNKSCSFDRCEIIFGDGDALQAGRDLKITEAHQGELDVAVRDPSAFIIKGENGDKPLPANDLIDCCFPTLTYFNVRAGNQWVVSGSQAGFLHHVIADPATGVCRNSCDPRLSARQNGRVRASKSDAKVTDGQPGAFINPMFRFAVLNGHDKNGNDVPPKRDFSFHFTTQNGFAPLLVDLSGGVAAITSTTTTGVAAPTPLIQPVGIHLVPATGELAITDGSINGLIVVNLSSVGVTKTFF